MDKLSTEAKKTAQMALKWLLRQFIHHWAVFILFWDIKKQYIKTSKIFPDQFQISIFKSWDGVMYFSFSRFFATLRPPASRPDARLENRRSKEK